MSIRLPKNFWFAATATLYLSALLVGGLSLARINEAWGDLGWIGEVRIPLFLCVLPLVAARIALTRHAPPRERDAAKRWVAWVCILHFYLVLSILWNPFGLDNIDLTIDILLLVAMLTVGYYIVEQERETSANFVLRSCFVFSVGWLAIGVVLHQSIPGEIAQLGAMGIGSARVTGSAIIICMHFWLKGRRWYYIALIPFFLTAIFLSGSRGAILALFFGLASLFILNSTRILRNILWGFPAACVIWLLASSNFFRESAQYFWASIWMGGKVGEALYFAERDELFLLSWEVFKEKPLFGHGLGAFSMFSVYDYPHNIISNIAVDGGSAGLFLLLIPLLMLARQSFRGASIEQRTAISLGVFFFVGSLLTGTYYDARMMWFFWLLGMLPADPKHVSGIAVHSVSCTRHASMTLKE